MPNKTSAVTPVLRHVIEAEDMVSCPYCLADQDHLLDVLTACDVFDTIDEACTACGRTFYVEVTAITRTYVMRVPATGAPE